MNSPVLTSPILAHRIQSPGLSQALVLPPGLFQLLDRALTDKQVTVLVAPSGYGKTTAVAAWLDHLRSEFVPWLAVWHTLADRDNSLRAFIGNLIAAARVGRPGVLTGLERAATELPTLSPEQLASQFVRDIDELPDFMLLVFDGFEVITQPDVIAFVRSLMRHQPWSLRVVITSRSEPPLDLQGLFAGSQINRLTAMDLALADEQARALLSSWSHGPDSRTPAQADNWALEPIIAAAKGHPLKLQLAGYLLSEGMPPQQIIDNMRPRGRRGVMPALHALVLETLPPDECLVLRRLAHLANVRADLAAFVLQPRSQQGSADEDVDEQTLARLFARKIFLDVVDGEERWYCFRTHWREQAEHLGQLARAEPQRAADDRRAAAWFLEHGYVDEALDCLENVGDETGMADLVESLLPDLMDKDEWNRITQLIARVPAGIRDGRPRLLLAQAWWAWLALERDRLGELVNKTRHALETSQTAPEQAAIVSEELDILLGSPAFTTCPPDERMAQLERILAQLPKHRLRARAEALAGLRDATAPGPESEALADHMLREINGSGAQSGVQARLMVELGRLYVRLGPLDQLEAICREGLSRFTVPAEPVKVAAARLGLGIAAYCRDDPIQTKVQLEAVLHVPSLAGMEVVASIAHYLSSAYGQLGLTQLIEPMMRILRRDVPLHLRQSPSDDWSALEAYAALHAGNLHTADEWANVISPDLPLRPNWSTGVAFVEIRLVQEQPDLYPGALEIIERYIDITRQYYFYRNLNRSMVLRARLLWRMGDRDAAARELIEAIAGGYPLGFRRWFVDGGPEIAEMLALLAADSPVRAEASALRQHLAQRIAMPQHPRVAQDEVMLSRREQEVLQLMAESLPMKEIARRLHLSEHTIRNHATRIYARLDVAGRDAAVRRGRELGLFPPSR